LIRDPLAKDPPDDLPVPGDAASELTEKPVKHPNGADENGEERAEDWGAEAESHGWFEIYRSLMREFQMSPFCLTLMTFHLSSSGNGF
jgi:hypothetical protein